MSDTTLLADSVDRMLAQHADGHAGPPFAEAMWSATAAAGFAGVLADDAGHPGTDAMRAAATILRRCARVGAPIPIAEAMLAAWLAARAGWPDAPGLTSVAIEGTHIEPSRGSLPAVPWGRHAGHVIALVQVGNESRLARYDRLVVDAPGHNLADEPRDALRIEAAPLVADRAIDAREVIATAALLRAAQLTGAMEATLELALEHAKTRQQFGRPIGAFQAVQQLLARHAGEVAAAAAAVDLAVDRWDAPSAVLHAAIAKARAGEAAGTAAECAHQVIAAMGFSLEHPLQRLTRRLWTWRDDYGNESYWNDLVGARILAAGADAAWSVLIDEPALVGHPA
mgnify:FL=1